MPDTFPALQADAASLIKRCNDMILLARTLRSNCARGDAEAARETCRAIGTQGEALGEFCEAFAATTDHFVVYEDSNPEA